MPVPAKKRVKHYRGDDFRLDFRLEKYTNPEDPSEGSSVVDLTGWTAEVEGHPDEINDEPIGLTVSTPDDTGVIEVYMPAASTLDTSIEVIEFDVSLINPAGFRRTYLRVTMTLIDQVP